MKKFMIIALFLMAICPNVFAFSCNTSMTPGKPDECWSLVTVSSAETTLVSRGTVLVMDTQQVSSEQAIQRAKVSSVSGDTAVGVAQQTIASGQSAMVLVRGYGFIKTNGGHSAGQKLYTAASGGTGNTAGSQDASVVGTQLETGQASQTRRAFITIV